MKNTKQLAGLGLLLALALIFSYIEYLIPLPIGIPGVKLGLANSLILLLLYRYDLKTAAGISFLRIVLTGFLFGNLAMILYSLAGALCSMAVMWGVKKTDCFSLIGVSILGGVAHNFGQLFVAVLTLKTIMLSLYFPVLMISGCITGAIIGMIAHELQGRLGRNE